MAPKNKNKLPAGHDTAPYNGRRFWGTGSSLYKKYFSNRSVIPGRDMVLGNPELMTIEHMFTGRGWDSLLKGGEVAYIQIVQEFYSNFRITDETLCEGVTFLRGKELPVSKASIAESLRIPVFENPDYSLTHSPSSFPDMGTIIAAICKPRSTTWETGSFQVSKLDTPYRILFHLVCANILPKKRSSEVIPKVASFMYAFYTGLSIDLPGIIFGEMRDNAEAKVTNSGLPYGSFITRLAREAGVPMSACDGMEVPKGPITDVSISRSKAHSKGVRSRSDAFPQTTESSSSGVAALVPDLPASQITLGTIYSALRAVAGEVVGLRDRFDAVYPPADGDDSDDHDDDS